MTAIIALNGAAGLCLSSGATAQLSPRYQDLNADLVADQPEDSQRWRYPSILVFAYTPV